MYRLVLLLVLPLAGCCLFEGSPIPVLYDNGVTDTGVVWRDTRHGLGEQAGQESRVRIHYEAWLLDGTPLDSTHDRGIPEVFLVSEAPVPGWSDGIPGMRAGSMRMLTVPPERAFGDEGIEGLIPPGASLRFEIELLELE